MRRALRGGSTLDLTRQRNTDLGGQVSTEAEHIDPTEHVSSADPRYDGFRIKEFWILTSASGGDDQEALLWLDPTTAHHFHLTPGPTMASDERRLVHLREYAKWVTGANPGYQLKIRHFIPEGEDECFGG